MQISLKKISGFWLIFFSNWLILVKDMATIPGDNELGQAVLHTPSQDDQHQCKESNKNRRINQHYIGNENTRI